MNDGQIDFDRFDENELVESFAAIDRQHYPINFERLKQRLESLGYEIMSTRGGLVLRAPPEAAGRRAALREAALLGALFTRDSLVDSPIDRTELSPRNRRALNLMLAGLGIAAFGYIIYRGQTGDFGPIATIGFFLLLATIPGSIGCVLTFRSFRELPRTRDGALVVLLAIAMSVAILFVLFTIASVVIG